jgi:hypothetical protein
MNIANLKGVMDLHGEALKIFQYTATGAEEYYETVGEYKLERYELNTLAAQWMASGTCKLEAIQYFQQDALSQELMWEYKKQHCRKLVEEATGSTMSTDDLFKIETMEEGAEFLWKCLLARKYGEKGTVLWYSTCQSCGKQETKERSSCDVPVARVPSTAAKNAKDEIGRITDTNTRSGHQESKRKINASFRDAQHTLFKRVLSCSIG